MERRSFGMCGDSDVKPLFPVPSSASTLPLSLPDLYSAVTSHLASLPSENQKSRKNVGTAKKENILPLVAAQRKEREAVLKELFVNDASHIVSIYNSVSMESALSEAGKATKNDADGYGMFEDRIQKVVKQMKTQADHSKIKVSQSPGRTQDNPTQLMKSGESRRSQKSLLQRQQTNVMKKPAGIQAAEVNEILTTLSVMEGGGEKKGSAGSVGSPTHSEEETERDYLRPGQGHLGYWGSREEEGLRYAEQKEERTDSRSVVKRARLEMTSSQFVPTDITAELEEAARRGKKEERVGEKRRAKTLSPPLNTLRHSVQSVSSTTATAATQNTANRRGSPLLRFSVDSKENWLAMSQLKATRSKSPVLVGEKTKESRRVERSVGMSVDSVATRKSGKSWMDRSSGLETTDASLALPHLPQSSNQTPLSGKTHSSRVAVELAMKTLQNDSTSQSHPKSAFVGVTGKTRTRPVIHTSTQSQRGVNGEEIAKAQPIPNPDFVLQEGMGTRVVKTSSIGGILQHATKLSGFEVWPAELDFGEMSGTTGAGLENGKCLERNDGNLYRTHFVIQNNGLDSERWMVSTFDGKRGCFRVTTAPSLVAPGMSVKVNVECNTAIVKRGVCEKEGVRTVRERVGDSEGESGDEAERSRKPVDSQKPSDPLPFSYSTSETIIKPILGGCGPAGRWGVFRFGEKNEKCFGNGQKSRLGKIIWSQCAVQGRKELFGERTVDDVTVKDSRIENDEPKRANNFWTIGGDPRIYILVRDLVASSAGSPTDFVPSIVIVLSSPHSSVVAAALSFLNRTNQCVSPEIRLRLMESGLISDLLRIVQPYTLQISGNEIRLKSIIEIITTDISLASAGTTLELHIVYTNLIATVLVTAQPHT
ncbi:hypothetical protein BLNAU_5006 [Blattamonas nauphoetae]|uniref:Uncharacterized protein n=1 Tax=Blattamonas nauphoetae TaxID=2049346 RepID=A0ABQ9Y8P7_9EUKA|nr:hypothetical protein BLNAU_5006 [Blattamonas nauphoetae]